MYSSKRFHSMKRGLKADLEEERLIVKEYNLDEKRIESSSHSPPSNEIIFFKLDEKRIERLLA